MYAADLPKLRSVCVVDPWDWTSFPGGVPVILSTVGGDCHRVRLRGFRVVRSPTGGLEQGRRLRVVTRVMEVLVP